eukprot:scaffold2555_cov282-Prasinococcus_capsulatus_cf.AAC.2
MLRAAAAAAAAGVACLAGLRALAQDAAAHPAVHPLGRPRGRRAGGAGAPAERGGRGHRRRQRVLRQHRPPLRRDEGVRARGEGRTHSRARSDPIRSDLSAAAAAAAAAGRASTSWGWASPAGRRARGTGRR